MRRRLTNEDGFTFIELLVVMVIIGILAAIALSVFNGQTTKAQDSEAKMNAGSMQAHVESCYVETEDYGECETGDPGLSDTRMPEGTGPAQTTVNSNGPRDYVIASTSRSGNVFRLVKLKGEKPNRSCSVSAHGERGGCHDDSSW
jgi:prepilin-type N-terminal cleavage/methylation domain-containing protein